MFERSELCFVMKESQGACVRQIGILSTQDGDLFVCRVVFRDKNRGSTRLFHSRCVSRVGKKSYLTWPRIIESGRAADLEIGRGCIQPSAYHRCKFREFHGASLSQHPSSSTVLHDRNRVNLQVY